MDDDLAASGLKFDDAKTGLEYHKLVFGQAELVDRFLFDLTKYNLIAFAALAGLSSTGALFTSFGRLHTITLLAAVAVAVSFCASLLVFYYRRYSIYLYERAWIIEKAWLRGRSGGEIVSRLREHNKEWVKQHRAGIGSRLRDYFTFFPMVNLLPAVLALGLIMLVSAGIVPVS